MSWRYLLGFVVLLIVFDIALGIYATAQLNHQLDLIRQKGEPLTLEELVSPPAPGEKNITNIYRRAQANIHFEIDHTTVPPPDAEDNGTPYDFKYIPTYTNEKQTAAYLAKNGVAINLIRQASSESKYYFDLHLIPYGVDSGIWVKGVNVYNQMNLLSLQAIYEAHTGNTNAALQDVRHLFLMMQQFSTIPNGTNLGQTHQRIFKANEILSKVLLTARISPAQARAFEASLPTIDLKPLAYRDFLVGRITSINRFEFSSWPYLLFNDNFPAETSLLKFRGILNLITTPLRKLDETRALKWLAITYKRYHKLPFPMPPQYLKTQMGEINAEMDKEPWYAIGTKLTAGVFPDNIAERIEIARRERIIALALAAFHTQNHHYPSTLKSLEEFWGSALPKDLYSGKSFRYRSDGKTFHLYSIGIDRVDGGGKTDTYPRSDDIVWQNNAPW